MGFLTLFFLVGQHYSEKWGDDRGRGMDERPRIGDVTARLLAALVSDSDGVKKTKRKSDLDKKMKEEAPPVSFNKELAHQIDHSLKDQLVSIQLLGKDGLPPPYGSEDDEICETIRSLQAQLKKQISLNNSIKAELRPLVEKRLQAQAKEEDTRKIKRYDCVSVFILLVNNSTDKSELLPPGLYE